VSTSLSSYLVSVNYPGIPGQSTTRASKLRERRHVKTSAIYLHFNL